ncbi:hypothetical protein ACFYO0_45435 [Streptomyces sp. NPDC006365]|uniref:hypothetical protein n=1 Tax=Streptomyces sp. NPDC006365 TaxID=3364744 RepID=UPI003677EA34
MRQYDRLDEQPWWTPLTRLWCGAAVLGIGASLWAFWLTYDDARDRAASERQIAEACGGLVSGEDLMDLRGGMVRAKPDTSREVDPQYPPGVCRIYRVPEPGKSDGLLTLALRTISETTPLHSVGDDIGSEPFDYFGHEEQAEDEGDVTRQADRTEGQPLGDGTLGVYGADFVTVRADCAPAASDSVPDLLTVTARADYEEVSDEDVSRLADITHKAAAAAAGELGCDVRLRALPTNLDPVSRTLKTATAAHDSCAWYSRYIKHSGRGHLPDRALEVPTASRSTEEPCLLAVSPAAVRAMRNLTGEGLKYADSALTHFPWWMRTVSYFGPDARSVGYDDAFNGDGHLEAGTAGINEGAEVLWASSTCQGKPALHTLTISYTYGLVILDRAKSLFRAYVDDIAERRDCMDVRFPTDKDFDGH